MLPTSKPASIASSRIRFSIECLSVTHLTILSLHFFDMMPMFPISSEEPSPRCASIAGVFYLYILVYTICMNTLSPSLRIGVLRGGPSPEYDISLASGTHILKHLSEIHRPIDIYISRDGTWHMHGKEKSPERILKHVDVIFNALHGTYGEDGSVQQLLTHYGIPFTGSSRVSSAIAMNKSIAKDRAKKIGIKTPIHVVVRKEDSLVDKIGEIFNSIPHPVVVKPASSGSSLGVYLANTRAELATALETVLSMYESAIAEEYMEGTEVSCVVLDNFRGSDMYSMPPIEIRYPKQMPVLTHVVRYTDDASLVYPHTLRQPDAREVEDIAKQMHQSLGLSHYSNSDFIVSPKRGVYYLESNSQPKFGEKSVLAKSLQSMGISMEEFITQNLLLALKAK